MTVLSIDEHRERKIRNCYEKIRQDSLLCDRIMDDILTLPDSHVARIMIYCRKILKKEEDGE